MVQLRTFLLPFIHVFSTERNDVERTYLEYIYRRSIYVILIFFHIFSNEISLQSTRKTHIAVAIVVQK